MIEDDTLYQPVRRDPDPAEQAEAEERALPPPGCCAVAREEVARLRATLAAIAEKAEGETAALRRESADWQASAASHARTEDALRKQVEVLTGAVADLPHGQLCLSHGNRFVCTGDCGPGGTYVDEDGCCTTCGADAEPRKEPGPCTCWKSKVPALLRGEGPAPAAPHDDKEKP